MPASRVLVLDGHPDGTSLCSALAAAAAETARARGGEVRVMQLSAMDFDPNLAHGYNSRMDHEPDIAAFLDAVRWCDTFILVHPLWWGAAPAKLKGLIDRAFLPEAGHNDLDSQTRPIREVLDGCKPPVWHKRHI